ncbi:MAG: lysophospholipid acyltransferase family protein [Gemmatimonadales bacterium]
MRTIVAHFALVVLTPVLGGAALLLAFLGIPDGPGTLSERLQRWWVRALLWASGVTIVVHGAEYGRVQRQIFVANHLSRFDILALHATLRHVKFVAKAELARLPVFGRWARVAGTIYIQRDKTKSSFESYREAASKIDEGASVVVFAEGTRSPSYALRPFKNAPFVLAISAQRPIVPTVIHGSLEVQPKGTFRVRAGRIDVHFLEPVPVAGLTYEDRDRLASTVRERIAVLLHDTYGVESPAWEPRRVIRQSVST